MLKNQLLDQFNNLNMWTRGSERAPHKPLLLLLALGRLSRGEPADILYSDIADDLKQLLMEFGPPRKSYHPEFPFWHLQSDGVWFVRDAADLALKKGGKSPSKGELIKKNAVAGFDADVLKAFKATPALIGEVAGVLLENNFPATLHDDILTAVGLDLSASAGTKKKRDPAFRAKVLRAYEHRCAVCGFDLRLGAAEVALEAAHIMWHQAGGPDIEQNGLALCTMHHKLLDRGAYTVSKERVVLVSQEVSGAFGVNEVLLRHHGEEIREPQSSEYLAKPEYLVWHGKEVFRGPART